MKNIITSILSAGVAAFAMTATVSAADVEVAAPVSVEGTATCAKCDLETADACQSVLQVEKDGKTETYVLAGKAGGDWHKNICKGAKHVKATGTLSGAGDKKVFTATDIEITDKAKKDDAAKEG